ncbi:hypothetical protein [Paraburkholderia sp. WP4_3_2]|uniref:hypothetical protein n=1 Tax=Paraburkholderia sp. WP4_3_2 TaxID=2587162 RepID=UPI00160755B7|nr:hypothetical protein [Paraburkholderia sp. WP4_3_2]MBB3258645.1 hypothetical protein [Paraburkholderia sp. WP4_3_2]
MDCESYHLGGKAGDCATIAPLGSWRGHFTRAQRTRVREALGLGRHAVLVTSALESLKDEDDPSRLADLERLGLISSLCFVLHGSAWALRSAAFARFAQRYGNRVIYAGSSRKLYEDIRLVAAADLILPDASAVAGRGTDARHLREMALGGAFDADMRRLLLDCADMLGGVQAGAMQVIRGELDRCAEGYLNGAYAAQHGQET